MPLIVSIRDIFVVASEPELGLLLDFSIDHRVREVRQRVSGVSLESDLRAEHQPQSGAVIYFEEQLEMGDDSVEARHLSQVLDDVEDGLLYVLGESR